MDGSASHGLLCRLKDEIMKSLPPDIHFRLDSEECKEIVRLRATRKVNGSEALSEVSADWIDRKSKPDTWPYPNVKSVEGRTDQEGLLLHLDRNSYTLYPFLGDIIHFCDVHASSYKHAKSNVPHSDTLRYKLLGDAYQEGLFEPTPSNHRLHGLLDFLYFPDKVKAEAGGHFGELIRLWELMALTLDDTLYRHSGTAYGLYAPLWSDIHLRFEIGAKLVNIATYYGDYWLATHILDFLEKQLQLLDNDDDHNYYSVDVARLRLNASAHYHDEAACSSDLKQYRVFCELVKSNIELAPLDKRGRHLELLRAICRGGTRFAVRYILRVLVHSDDIVSIDALDDALYLATELNALGKRKGGSNSQAYSNHDLDTQCRGWSVLFAEAHMFQRDFVQARQSLDESFSAWNKSRAANKERIKDDFLFLSRILSLPNLSKWTAGVKYEKIEEHVGSMYRYWQGTSYAILKVQMGRFDKLSSSSRGKERFVEANESINELLKERHSPKLRHSGYLLASVQQIIHGKLEVINEEGRNADGGK